MNLMDRWTDILKIPVCPKGSTICRLAASLCISSTKALIREKNIANKGSQLSAKHASSLYPSPQTIVLGFSKGGVVLNQLIAELGFSDNKCMENPPQPQNFSEVAGNQIVPLSRQSFLDSITDIHYVDVGLNSLGAYPTVDIDRIADCLIEREKSLCFLLHGTPRQWSDLRRPWIREEKDKFYHILDNAKQKSNGKLEVFEKTCFADSVPDIQMHFEIIEKLDAN